MSSEKKVRFNRRVKNNGEKRETEEHIYDNAEYLDDVQSREGGPHTNHHLPVQRPSSKFLRGAALRLGVLCLLMTAGIIILFTLYISGRTENEQLQSSFNNLSNRYNQSENEIKQLQDQIKGKLCPEGWKKFGYSCYFKSSKKNIWVEGRTDCKSRGSDLVTINSKEEQDFVTSLNENDKFWIGLETIIKSKPNEWEWEWVDGSPLTETSWAEEHLKFYPEWYAVTCDPQGKWKKNHYDDRVSVHWICEKEIFSFI
ncbi:CD209 antigen-like protein E isoform X2 [Anabas testudineus]|uniref:CD209 antigen-like protein E isoform X2 n=1 Tax=Anabas testudineus TaxID=64144 RepID=UPI000E4598B1|nr:CD209 antigen-like protein E isoform X2 [Anabas testudineus]